MYCICRIYFFWQHKHQLRYIEHVSACIHTDLRTLPGQSVVDLQPGDQLAHLPRPELLSCGHIDQIFHYGISA